ncbi:Endonuclease/exonuclease/phosphatase [Pilobolus umbonatus]|nr:Endonuclease/exonuclease/phosphatase [Pilobolus umbonatus]
METNTEAYIRYDPTKENAWVNLILGSLRNNGREYYKVASKQLVTMLLIVIAKKSHSKHITNVSSTYAGVGLMNMMGNKGGIAIRFRFHDSYLCFVTSHLAAFVDKTEKRNQDFVELTKRLILPAYRDPKMNYISYHWNDGGDEGVAFMEHNNVLKNWTMESSIFHSDILVWCGDLNYRIGMTESEIKNDIRRKNYERLLEYDQLSIERTAGRTFPMFDEGTITFNPTYKYDPGTDHYDSSPKRRAPSWTDRILWKRERAGMKSPLKLIDYDDCKSVCMSDHKPVRALMSFQIRTIDHKRQAKTHESLIQHSKENQDIQPRGTITSSYVKFNKIEFLDFQQQRITLENTGQVLIVFKFIPRQDETAILPPWLNVYPLSGVLAPGESVLIQFEIFVDQTCSTPLNQMEEVMETILILRLENARDLFVEVSAEYVPTCFGTYLEKLPSMTIPLDDDVIDNFLSATSPTTTVPEEKEDALQIQLPACLWKILNFLWNPNMMQIESLFLGHGNLKHSSDIREWLDNDKQMAGDLSLIGPSSDKGDTSSIHSDMTDLTLTEEKKSADIAASANSMIDILIFFLEFLPEPVITSDRYKAVINASSYTDAIDMLRNTLPPCHKNVLFYVVLFLRQVIDRAPESCYKSRKEAIVERFTVLLKPPADYKEHNPKVAKEKRERFICQLIDSITYDESVH